MNQDSTKGDDSGGEKPARTKLRASIERDAKEVAEFASACLPVRDEGDAIVREVFVSAYEDAVSSSGDPFSRARLFGKARRLCARATERRRKEAHEAPARGREIGSRQRAMIAELRPTEREAVLLKYVAQLSDADLAEACVTDEPTARQRVSSAVVALAKATKAHGAPSPVAPSTEVGTRRKEVEEKLTEILDGLAPDDLTDFVAEDDVSRDLVHDAERVVELVRALEADHEVDRTALFDHVIKTVEGTSASGGVAPTTSGSGTMPMGAVPESPKEAESGSAGQAAETDATDKASAAAEPAAPVADEATDAKGSEKEPKKTGSEKDDPASGETKSWSERLGQRGRLGVALGVAAFIGLVALLLSRSQRGPSEYADAAWAGKISDVSRAFGGGVGLQRCSPEGSSCTSVERGDDMPAGSTLRTDGQTRAIVELKDGSRVWLDRGSELYFDGDSARRARLVHGRAIVEVSDLGASRARIDSTLGFVETSGTKASLTVDPDAFGVEVARGSVRLIDTMERGVAVHAGEEGRLEPGQPPEVSASAYLGNAFRWSERTFSPAGTDETALAGLGELRAKKPGDDQERKGAVQLASHSTKVRIVGNVARTEIEEVFSNSADDVLEGIYRFPLPPDAQIERLALDVDGKLEEGAFVDRERAGAIWRGAIVNAGGKKPVAEEIVWVRGPWRDPALLEWQRGGRFELRIYPIPKHGSRRVILAYTQVIPPSGKVRRYVYPLPHDPSGSTRVGRFEVDAEVRGLDPKAGVVARGYEMQSEALPEGGKKLRLSKEGFVANGDLSIEFALPNPNQEVTAWAYEPSPDEVSAERSALAPASSGAGAPLGFSQPANVGAPFAAVAIRPKLPRAADDLHRAFAIVVDSSRSMFGERYRRAVELASRLVQEMDRGDHATVLACDSTCRELPSGAALALGDRARTVRDFLMGVTPEGASDVAGAIRHARETLRGAPNGSGRIVYIGDGTPTVGAVQPAFVRREIGAAVPREFGTVTTVAVGTDADVGTLRALAESAGGVMVPYTPGQGVAEAVYAVLGATFGSGLADVEIDVPDGLVDVTPRRLATIPAGGEAIFTARMTRPNVEGTLRVRGRVGGTPFEQRYPIRVEATTAKGNAFVPRLFAAMKIADLEDQPDADSRKRAVDLSGRYHVASRYTSLLVLESAAMFKAFGLDQAERTAAWTGEDEAKSTSAEGELAMADDAEEAQKGAFDSKKDEVARGSAPMAARRAASAGAGYMGGPSPEPAEKAKAPSKPSPKRSFDYAEGESARSESVASPPPSPAPANPYGAAQATPGRAAPAPMASSPATSRPRELASDLGTAYEMRPPPPPPPPRFRWVPMKKVWERVGHIVTPATPPAAASPDAIAQAERAVQDNDLKREAVKKLYTLYFLSGDIQHASSVAEKWSEKDPLDPDALTARADVAAARGDRDLAIRILGSVVDVRPGDHKAQWRLARLNRWAGRAELGCRFSMAVAQIRTGDAKLIVEAVRCSRDIGHAEVAGDLMSGADAATRRIIDSLLGEAQQDPSALTGDFRLEAHWDGGDDLDLAMLHQEGRMSWLGAPTKAIISARDVQSTSREALALRGGSVGDYVVEITRPLGHSGVVRGTVDISAPGGDRRSVPFVLDGDRVRIALVKVTARSKLVPL